MKKIILFCLCLLGIFLIGCPNGGEGTTQESNSSTDGTYKIAFNANGGSGTMESITCSIGEKVTLPPCSFNGVDDTYYMKNWTLTQDGSGKSYDEFTKVKDLSKVGGSTVTLYAQWAQCITPGTIEPLPDTIGLLRKARNEINPSDNEIIFFYYRNDEQYDKWALWFWSADETTGEVNWDAINAHGYSTIMIEGKKIGYMKFNSEGTSSNDCIPLTENGKKTIEQKGIFNFIVRQKSGWEGQTNDLKWDLMEGNYFGLLAGNANNKTATTDENVYSIADDAKPQLMNSLQLSDTEIVIGLSQKYAVTINPSDNGFSVISESGTEVSITDAYNYILYGDARFSDGNPSNSFRGKYNYSKQFLLKLSSPIGYDEKWYVKLNEYVPTAGLYISPGTAAKKKSSEMTYSGNDLGLTLNNTTAGFKVFAPVATEANVLLYTDWTDAKTDIDNVHGNQKTDDPLTNGTRIAMKKASDFNTTGVWEISNVDISGRNYYIYELNNFGIVYRVCDINAFVAAPDSVAAQIINIDDDNCKPDNWETEYTNPFGKNGTETKTYTEAIIYEMHIRDWSKGIDANNIGKFDDITAGLGTNGNGTLGQHLKDLGITHVQILPMFDYAETNADTNYNWGYNPYHYNVPEGRYTNNHDNGGHEAVKQMRDMIKAFHDAGIAVNMDVVYNHTNGTGTGSLYDMTVPYYYYRLASGAYSNGSGCGNETDSSMPMYRKYMIDSLSHWMKDYHINGFRFDLMGLHEAETMAEIYTALSKIDKNVMVYGEPWTGGTSPVNNSSTKAGKVDNAGYGAFDDDFRNAIKGGEFGGFEKGQVQGTYEDDKIIAGLKGTATTRNDTGVAGLSIHYVECHDNYTLFDKLDISIMNGTSKSNWVAYDDLTTDKQNAIRAQDKLAAAFVFLAQGTPFMNGGQEFMRTKHGNENSYNYEAGDNDNAIDMSFKTKYNDVYNVYKGLIALRKSSDAFTKGQNVTAEAVKEGITKYITKGTNDEFCIYFNATLTDETADTTGYSKVIDITTGEIKESTALPTKVDATNLLILKK